MGQDWKTLTLVVIGAAVAGWLVVRIVTSSGSHADAPTVAMAPAERREAPAPAEPTDEEAAGPRRTPSAGMVPPPASADDASPDAIVRDLDVLAQALVRDQRIEDRVLPRINDGLDVPGVVEYRRAPDFWEPAFAGSGGAKR